MPTSADYVSYAQQLSSALEAQGLSLVDDDQLAAPTGPLAGQAPELLLELASLRPERVELSKFLDRCASVATDPAFGHFHGFGNGSPLSWSYRYLPGEGAPSQELLGAVAHCIAVSTSSIKNPSVERTLENRGLSAVMRKLLAHYGSKRLLSKALMAQESGLALTFEPDVPQREEPSAEPAPVAISVRDLLSSQDEETPLAVPTDLLIEGYPSSNWVYMDTPEAKAELQAFVQEVDCEPFSPFAAQLRELVGYDGQDEDSWRAQLAHDWHNAGINPLEGGARGWWRSTNLHDTTGRQIFALLTKGAGGVWRLDELCSADVMERDLGIRATRSPKPLYHTYDYLHQLLAKVRSRRRELERDKVAERIEARISQGRELSQTDLHKLTDAYMGSWQRVREFVRDRRLSTAIGLTSESTIDELLDTVSGLMTLDDPRSEWVDVLRRVVTGCGECFVHALPSWGGAIPDMPPMFVADIEQITEASEHFESLRGQLDELSDFYETMVRTFRETEAYGAHGEALERVEERLGDSVDILFTRLRDEFRAADLPMAQLQSARRRLVESEAPEAVEPPATPRATPTVLPPAPTRTPVVPVPPVVAPLPTPPQGDVTTAVPVVPLPALPKSGGPAATPAPPLPAMPKADGETPSPTDTPIQGTLPAAALPPRTPLMPSPGLQVTLRPRKTGFAAGKRTAPRPWASAATAAPTRGHHIAPLVDVAEGVDTHDEHKTLVKGCERYYHRAVERGRAADLVKLTGFGGALPLAADDHDPQGQEDFAFGTGGRSLEDLVSCMEAGLDDRIRPTTLHRIIDAFDEPEAGAVPHDLYLRYLCTAVVSARLGATENPPCLEQLEYFGELAVIAVEQDGQIADDLAASLAEALLYLVTHRFCGHTVTLLQRLCVFLGAAGERCLAQLEALRARARNSYLGDELGGDDVLVGDTILRELDRMRGADELAKLEELARLYGPGSYTHSFIMERLWNWLLSDDCPERFARIAWMLEAMTGQRGDADPLWSLSDPDDADDFLTDIWMPFLADIGEEKKYDRKVWGAGRVRFCERLISVSGMFDRFCAIRALADTNYTDQLSHDLAACLLAVCNALVELPGCDGDSRYGKLAHELLHHYPASSLSWGREGPLAMGDGPTDVTPAELAFAELMQHASQADATHGRAPRDYLPTETDLVRTTDLINLAKTYNVIDSQQRDQLRNALAGVLGVREHVAQDDSDSLTARLALWCHEYVGRELDRSLREALTSLRDMVRQHIESRGAVDRDHLRAKLAQIDTLLAEGGSFEEVLAHGDFLEEADALVPDPPAPGPDDLLYRTGMYGAVGMGGASQHASRLYDLLRSDLAKQGRDFYPSPHVDGLPRDINRSETPRVRDWLKTLSSIVEQSAIPRNGRDVTPASEEGSDAIRRFANEAAKLLACVGFPNAVVMPQEDGGSVKRFTLDFLLSPSATLDDGSPVCPLRQLVSMDAADLAPKTNARLALEVYTSYEALREGARMLDEQVGCHRVALYLGSTGSLEADDRLLSLADRVELQHVVLSTNREGTGYLLLDRVLLAFLLHYGPVSVSAERYERLGVLFRCASQFTYLHPYFDRGLSNEARREPSDTQAPPVEQPSLFYGRRAVLDSVMSFDAGGINLVYGARRMGKTTILREAESIAFAERAAGTGNDVVGYQDMRGHTGGGVDNFWVTYVGDCFSKALPGAITGLSTAQTARQVQDALLAYIDDTKAHLLLLLDEADGMVTNDARTVGADGISREPLVSSLYAFAQRSHHRFKFVLCGLHGTLRYAASNTAMGHLGEPLGVAPLWEDGGYVDAYRLAYEPLKAMGIRLSHESVLAIIMRAGYYPNLINQICERLLDKVRRRRDLWAKADELGIVVSDALVNSVLANFNKLLEDNFEKTIGLDRIYGVIVAAMAVLGTSEGWGVPVRIRDIDRVIVAARKRCHIDHPFTDIERYLDELVTFRVLRREDQHFYYLRDREMKAIYESRGAQNATQELEAALLAWDEERSRDVTSFHPELVRDRTLAADGTALLAPLNREQAYRVSSLLNRTGVCLIVGSRMSGLDLLARATREHPERLEPTMAGFAVRTLAHVPDELEPATDGAPGMLYLIEGAWEADDAARAQRLTQGDTRFVLLANPHHAWDLIDLIEGSARELTVRLTPWEAENQRTWLLGLTDDIDRDLLATFQTRTGGQCGLAAHVAHIVGTSCGRQDVLFALDSLAGEQILTVDLLAVLDEHPDARELITVMAEYPDVAFAAREWMGLVDAPLSETDMFDTLRRLVALGLLEQEGGPTSDGIDEKTPVLVPHWVARALGTPQEAGE